MIFDSSIHIRSSIFFSSSSYIIAFLFSHVCYRSCVFSNCKTFKLYTSVRQSVRYIISSQSFHFVHRILDYRVLMRGISESSPTRAMAEDLDVEAMLEAPYKKGVRLNFFFSLFLCVSVCSFEILIFFLSYKVYLISTHKNPIRCVPFQICSFVLRSRKMNRPFLSVYTCRTKYVLVSYRLLINTSVFCTYRWYVTCTLALVGCSAASSQNALEIRGIKKSHH